MRDPFADITAAELAELRNYRCEICGGFGNQRHHALVRRDRNRKWLDVLINYQLVCQACHTETCRADSRENRLAFYEKQCERFGKEVAESWLKNLPYKYEIHI